MPPKKGGKGGDKKKEKKPDGDEPEWNGPNIYEELAKKDRKVTQLEMDLNAPFQVLLKENVEFEVLVDRIQHTCMRIEEDNNRLEEMNGKIQESMNTQERVKETGLVKAVQERQAAKVEKVKLREDYEVSKKHQVEMREEKSKLEIRTRGGYAVKAPGPAQLTPPVSCRVEDRRHPHCQAEDPRRVGRGNPKRPIHEK